MELKELIFEIEWRDEQGAISDGPFSHPFITVEVSAPALRRWQRTEVMIDTGLSRSSFSPSVLALAGCVAGGSVRLSGSQGWQDFSTYQSEIRFPSFPNGIIGTEAASMDHALGQTGAGGLLGMDVIRLGRLVLDPGGRSYFSLTPPSRPRPAA